MRNNRRTEQRRPDSSLYALVLNASSYGDSKGVTRGLEGIVFGGTEDPFAQGLRALELRFRLGDLFSQQENRLERLSKARPSVLRGPEARRRAYFGPQLGYKLVRYSGVIDDYTRRFDERHKVRLATYEGDNFRPRATLALLRDRDTRDGTLSLIATQEFPRAQQLVEHSRRVTGAVNQNLDDLSDGIQEIGDMVITHGMSRSAVLDVRENVDATFEEVGAYLGEATSQLRPPEISPQPATQRP